MSYETLLSSYDDILKPEDVKHILRISSNTVYKYLANGTIRSFRIAGRYRIPKLYLLEYIYPDEFISTGGE